MTAPIAEAKVPNEGPTILASFWLAFLFSVGILIWTAYVSYTTSRMPKFLMLHLNLLLSLQF